MNDPKVKLTPVERVQDLKIVGDALGRGVAAALRQHKLAGNPVPESRNGKIRWVSAQEIPDFTIEPEKG